MNLKDFEHQIEVRVVDRGEEYHLNGCVRSITSKGQRYQATVVYLEIVGRMLHSRRCSETYAKILIEEDDLSRLLEHVKRSPARIVEYCR